MEYICIEKNKTCKFASRCGYCDKIHNLKHTHEFYTDNKNIRGVNMLKDAKVVTSKFLQLRDKLNNSISGNRGYDMSPYRAVGCSETTLNIHELQKAFGELCELLHELTVEEDNT